MLRYVNAVNESSFPIPVKLLNTSNSFGSSSSYSSSSVSCFLFIVDNFSRHLRWHVPSTRRTRSQKIIFRIGRRRRRLWGKFYVAYVDAITKIIFFLYTNKFQQRIDGLIKSNRSPSVDDFCCLSNFGLPHQRTIIICDSTPGIVAGFVRRTSSFFDKRPPSPRLAKIIGLVRPRSWPQPRPWLRPRLPPSLLAASYGLVQTADLVMTNCFATSCWGTPTWNSIPCIKWQSNINCTTKCCNLECCCSSCCVLWRWTSS